MPSQKYYIKTVWKIPNTEIQFNALIKVMKEEFEKSDNKTELLIDLRHYIETYILD